MELGRRVNGLQGLDAGPWHLKSSYEVFDTDGKSRDKGTFEGWWVDAKQYKLAFHSPQLSFEEYVPFTAYSEPENGGERGQTK